MRPEPVDLIVRADHVLTMDQNLSLFEEGAIAVRDGRIVAVGPASTIEKRFTSSRLIGGRGRIALPGLINTHTHSAMVYFRGLADDLPLKIWLEEHIWPAEKRWLSAQFVSDAAELACIEMVKAGITTYADMYLFGDAIARSTKKVGLRAMVGSGVVDFPSATGKNADDYLANAERFIADWKGDDLIVPSIADHSLYTCSPATLKRSKALADRCGVMLQIHLSETEWEVQESLARFGRRPVCHLQHLGLLDRQLLAAHCIWLDQEELGLLAGSGTAVSHCIESNLKLASGIAPIPQMLKEGVRVSFGTDGAASNNDLSILSEMATAAKVHKALSLDPTALPAEEALLMATRLGAEALGMGQICGSLEPGKAADLILADFGKPHLLPLYDLYSSVVYSMQGSDIDTVIVAGKILMEGRKLASVEEEAVLAKAAEWGQKIRSSDRDR